jgi:hypothetical protein
MKGSTVIYEFNFKSQCNSYKTIIYITPSEVFSYFYLRYSFSRARVTVEPIKTLQMLVKAVSTECFTYLCLLIIYMIA